MIVKGFSVIGTFFLSLFLSGVFLSAPAFAGNLDSSGAPSAGSGMPTLQGIYSQLSSGAAATIPGAFQEPSSGPTEGTGKTLSDIQSVLPVPDNTNGATTNDVLSGKTFWGLRTDGTWGLKTGTYSPALAKRVNKTGQTQCWDSGGLLGSCSGTGQDGQYQYGVNPVLAPTGGYTGAYNTPSYTGARFIDNGDGTVTDNLTALIWLKNADCFSMETWANALTSANTLASSACGLSDGSSAGQWRLPNINELHSLGSAWPPGSPFVSVQSYGYWSSTNAYLTPYAWIVLMWNGLVDYDFKPDHHYVWPVRGGQ